MGAYLARRLLNVGCKVHLLVRHGYKPWRIESILGEIAIHEVEFLKLNELSGLIIEIRPDVVFHLAAYGAYANQNDIFEAMRTNYLATINIVQSAIQAKCPVLVNTGSSSEYGFKIQAPTEEEFVEPNSNYAATKAAATIYCQFSARTNDIYIPTLRLYSVYGPYEEPTRLIPKLVALGKQNELPKLSNPTTARDFIYIDDVADAYLAIASWRGADRGAIFNVGTGIQTCLKDLTSLSRKVMKISAEPVWGEYGSRLWDSANWVCNYSKISKETGWTPKTSLEQGLELTSTWFDVNTSMLHYYRQVIANSNL